jgi:hypothetical protein
MSYVRQVQPDDDRLKRVGTCGFIRKLEPFVVSTISYITINLKAQWGCPTVK